MNMKKVILPLVALFAGSFAFAQIDGYEPDWNNPDEVGNVFVCFEEGQSQGEVECIRGNWFTVDQIPDGNDSFKADAAQLDILVKLYDEYNGLYKVASTVQKEEKVTLKNRHIYLYPIVEDYNCVLDEVDSLLAFRKVTTKSGSFLVILPSLDADMEGEFTLFAERGEGRISYSLKGSKRSAVDEVTVIK